MKDIVERIKSQWRKFSRTAITRMVEPSELIEGLQETYGFSRARAEREVHEFQLRFRFRDDTNRLVPVPNYGRRISDS